MKERLAAHCACGAVSVSIVAVPTFINECNCSLCRKTGSAWGYFKAEEVDIVGATLAYVRQDKDSPAAAVHSCPQCGTTTHFELTESFLRENPSVDRMGVNMKIFEIEDLDGIEVRYPNGRDWTGKGAYDYRRLPQTISAAFAW